MNENPQPTTPTPEDPRHNEPPIHDPPVDPEHDRNPDQVVFDADKIER